MKHSDETKGCCTPARDKAATGQTVLGGIESTGEDGSRIVKIPGGTALLGTASPQFLLDGEGPLKRKKIKPFRMDSATVTNARFKVFVDATSYKTEAEQIGDSFVFAGSLSRNAAPSQSVVAAPWWRIISGTSWKAIHGPGSEMAWRPGHPVVHISWNDAMAFAKWAKGRLPTESEWEHAARGGLGDVLFPWGGHEPNDTDSFPCNIWQGQFPETDLGRDGYAGTAPSLSFEPNGYGLYNMVGNVWEWTSQSFKVKSLKKSVAAAHAGKEGFKLTKGGSFLCHVSYCYRYRIAARSGISPDSSAAHQGFRVVYDVN